jgi:FtsZ-binding cell division protein ZapB
MDTFNKFCDNFTKAWEMIKAYQITIERLRIETCEEERQALIHQNTLLKRELEDLKNQKTP